MDSQESPLVHHPPQFLPPPLPPHSHGIMAAPPTPPPPQSQPQTQLHQQEQPNSYILPTNAIFQQPQQQHNLQFPFNSVSGQNPKPNFLDHSDGSSVAAAASAAGAGAGAKKKRGRPRKYSADGNNGLGHSPTPIAQIPVNHADSGGGGVNGASSSENPSKKGRGRPPGSGKKQKQEALGAVGFGFTPHIIPVHTGEDIANKVMTFSLQGPRAVCILSGTGVVCNVTLRQSIIGGGTVTYEGQFNIISLSGSFLLSEKNGNRSRTGGLSVSLSGPDGRVLGGVVAGSLKAASPVQLVVGSFIPEKEKPMSEAPSSTPPPNMLNFCAPVTEASSPSPGASSDSADENGGSPLSHERGPFGNTAQPMHNSAQPMHGIPTYWGQAM
ncbi:AT-hook motif nuclear-localized protein 10-like [Solanum dulcamara]|uniref:AT-hook motif nuclear-localized protein 10-like n=1 Tax=Solanum dulcamara TaxID=45834 RepID=UPI0024861008|nr:AT-hook motif nuclear-localized protein 10-like [Solanum dulcamara]